MYLESFSSHLKFYVQLIHQKTELYHTIFNVQVLRLKILSGRFRLPEASWIPENDKSATEYVKNKNLHSLGLYDVTEEEVKKIIVNLRLLITNFVFINSSSLL